MKDIAIASFATEMDGRLAAQRLEAAGIRSVLVALSYGPGVWGTAAMLPHELRVLESEMDQARQLLHDHARPAARRRGRFRPHRSANAKQ